MAEIEVSKVKVAKNRKARPEAVVALAESIEEIGLLNPIILDEDNNLIAGLHRLMAHKHLALKDPDFKVIEFRRSSLDDLGRELARIDENLCRNQMTATERMDALAERKDVWERLHPETKHGAGAGKKKATGKAKKSKDPTVGSFATDTAKKTGVSKSSISLYAQAAKSVDVEAKAAIKEIPVEKSPGITELVKLGRFGPEQQREIVARVVETGETVKAAIKSLKRRDQLAEIKVYRPPSGKFQVITTDFSWPYRDKLDGSDLVRGGPPYPPMTLEEIVAFIRGPLANCCDETCLLGNWITGPISLDLTIAPIVQAEIEALGFKPLHERIWEKVEASGGDFTGLGRGVRWNAEKLQLFVRGDVLINEMGREHGRPLQSTVFRAPIGEHSEKPAKAYADLEELVPYTSRLEMFSRADRPGWVTSGSELPPKRQGWVEQAASKEEPKEEPAATAVAEEGGAEVADSAESRLPAATSRAVLDWKNAADGTDDRLALGHGGTFVYRVGRAFGKSGASQTPFHAKAGSAFLPGSWENVGLAQAACEGEERRRRAFGSEPSKKKRSRKFGPLDPLPSEVA